MTKTGKDDLISRKAAKEKFNDIPPFIGMTGGCVRQMLDTIPGVDAIPVNADELKHLINDTIAYIWRLEDRGCNKPEFGYESRKALLEKLKKFYNEHFPETDCHF